MTRRRLLLAGLGLLLALVVGAAAALGWLLGTQSGARFAVGRAVAASGGRLAVGDVGGRLSDELVLRNVAYRDPAAALDVDRLSLRLGLPMLLKGVVDVEELQSSPVRYRRSGEGAAGPSGGSLPALPLEIRVGRATIAGVSAVLGPERELTLERITLSGLAENTSASIRRFELRWQGFFLSLQGRVFWADGLSVDGLLSWSGAIDGRQWLGSANVDGRWPAFAIDEELLEPYAQTAAGTIDLSGDPAVDLEIELAGVGRAAVSARLDRAQSTIVATVSARDLTPAGLVPGWPGQWSVQGDVSARLGDTVRVETDDLSVEAELDDERLSAGFAGAFETPERLRVDRLDMALGPNRVSVSGVAGESLDVEIEAELGDLSALAAFAARDEIQALAPAVPAGVPLNGRATADLSLTGSRQMPRVAGELRVEDSRFADLPLALSLDFATPAEGESAIEIEHLEAALGASRVTGAGTIGADVIGGADGRAADADLDLMLEADVGDLAELAALGERDDVRALIGAAPALEGLGGAAMASVAVTGTLGRPRVAGEVQASDLSLGRVTLPSASLRADLGLFTGGPASLQLSASTDAWSARLTADGAIRAGVWSGTLGALELDERELGTWSLEAPVPLSVGPGRIELARTCLARSASSICAEWQHGSTDRLRLTADEFELPLLNPLLPETVALTGSVSVDARLDTAAGQPSGRISVAGAGIGFDVAVSETDRVTTTLDTVTLEATLDGYSLSLEAGLESTDRGRAEIRMSSTDVRDETAPISGRFDIVWPDLDALALLSPEIGEVGGTLRLSIDVAGTAREPALSGTAALDAGHVAVPEWGLEIDRIEARATSFDGGSVEFDGTGYVEDSEIRLSGVTELDPEAGWPTHMSLAGENVPVARRPDASVIASPDFDIEIELPRIDVSGRVVVPQADISVERLPSQAVQVSPDAIVHGGSVANEPVRPLRVTAGVTVELGDAVHYAGSNLDANLSGSLRVEYSSGLSTVAGGTLTLDGTYDAYGQSLDLQRGELLFAGPLNDPAIDVLAVRKIGSTTVGVRLNGTLLEPDVSMYSDPPMSEANALSYLMFGRPVSASAGTETATLQSAALSLGLQQALPVVQRVGETLGLDELSIETTDLDAGALMAGKYLSPKVYMSYSYGLFNRLGGFLLRYQINDHLSLETRSGNEKSMDLLYSVEKDD